MRHPFLTVIVPAGAPGAHRGFAEDEGLTILHAGDRRQRRTARAVRRDPVRNSLSQRSEQTIDHAIAGDPPGPRRAGRNRPDHSAFRRAHINGLGKTMAVRYIRGHDRAQRRIGTGLGERECGVHAARHHRRRSFPVDNDIRVIYGNSNVQDYRFRRIAYSVDMVGELVRAVGNIGNFCCCEAPRVIIEIHDGLIDRFDTVAVIEIHHATGAGRTSSHLRLQIAMHEFRCPHIQTDQLPQGFVAYPLVDQLQDRDPESFLPDLRRPERVRSGNDAANIRMMRQSGRPALQRTAEIDRFDDIDIRQVLSRRGIRVVHDEVVFGIDIVADLRQHIPQSIEETAEMHWRADPLCECPALRIAQRRGEIERVTHDLRIRGADDRQRDLFRDRIEGVAKHFQQEGIGRRYLGLLRVHGQYSRSITILSAASR